MQKRYGTLEKFLYTNPAEEASFLSGAFQSVSYGAASTVVGPLIALATLLVTHKTVSSSRKIGASRAFKRLRFGVVFVNGRWHGI